VILLGGQFCLGTFKQISYLCVYLDVEWNTLLVTSDHVLIRYTVEKNY